MAANRAYESELDMGVWVFNGQCPTCSGVLKYKYRNRNNPNIELRVLPNARLFQMFTGRQLTLQGGIVEMKEKLSTI